MQEVDDLRRTPRGQVGGGIAPQELRQFQNPVGHATADRLERTAQKLQQPVRQDHSPELITEVVNVVVGVAPMLHQRPSKRCVISSTLHQGQQKVAAPDIAVAIQLTAGNRPRHGDKHKSGNQFPDHTGVLGVNRRPCARVEHERLRTPVVHPLYPAVQPRGGVNVGLIQPQSLRDADQGVLSARHFLRLIDMPTELERKPPRKDQTRWLEHQVFTDVVESFLFLEDGLPPSLPGPAVIAYKVVGRGEVIVVHGDEQLAAVLQRAQVAENSPAVGVVRD